MTLLYILVKREKSDCAHPVPVHTAVLPRVRGRLVLDTAQTLPAPPPVAILHRLHRSLKTNMHTHTSFIHTGKWLGNMSLYPKSKNAHTGGVLNGELWIQGNRTQ